MCTISTLCLSGALAFAPAPASAGIAPEAPFAGVAAVSSNTLAYSYATARWSLTESNLLALDQQNAQQTFQVFSEIGRTQMDVWWSTAGAELIAASVSTDGP